MSSAKNQSTNRPAQSINEHRQSINNCDTAISQLEPVTFLKRAFYPYKEAMKALNCSTHPHQLYWRIQNFPNEIITVNAVSYISSAYFHCLANYMTSKAALMTLKNGGVQW